MSCLPIFEQSMKTFEELEETLIGADVGFETAIRITEALRQEVKLRNAKNRQKSKMRSSRNLWISMKRKESMK